MPKERHTIDETRYAYDILKGIREKHPHCTSQALDASVALRDAMVLMIIIVYASLDTGFAEIRKHIEGQQQQTIEFRSQLGMARASITRVAKCNTNPENAVSQVYRTPWSAQKIVDIFSVYNECVQATGYKRKKHEKKHELKGGSSIPGTLPHLHEPYIKAMEEERWQL